MTHTFEITIEALSQQEAVAKLKAATTLMQKLKTHEIARLAEIVATDPVKTSFAKKALGL